ncbi:MAG: DUF423 domain-containing protein [Pseudomonadota bacterium]
MQVGVISAGALGFVCVALGAFGAHGLDGRLSAEAAEWWETATFYGLVHAVAALAALSARPPMRASAAAFVIGAVIFSGTLYAMALGAPRWFGAITPIGGLALLAGWAQVMIGGARSR